LFEARKPETTNVGGVKIHYGNEEIGEGVAAAEEEGEKVVDGRKLEIWNIIRQLGRAEVE
jgi:hypothetical protein